MGGLLEREKAACRALGTGPDNVVARLDDALRLKADAEAKAKRLQKDLIKLEAARLAALGRMVDTLSYTATLARGFAVVRGADGILTSASAARAAGTFEIEFAGRETVPAQSLSAAPRPRARPKRSEPDRDDGQGSLL